MINGMRTDERAERSFNSSNSSSDGTCLGTHTLDPLWEVEFEEEQQLKRTIVRLNAMVRNCYLSHLRRVLTRNCELCSSDLDYNFTPHDVEKCAAELEILALRSCMVSSLYQKAMTQMTADIKQCTKESKLFEKFYELSQKKCSCSSKEDKTTQTECLNIKTEPDSEPENIEPDVITSVSIEDNTPHSEEVNSQTDAVPIPIDAMPIPVLVSSRPEVSHSPCVPSILDTENMENFYTTDTSSLWFGSDSSPLFAKKRSVKQQSHKKNGLCLQQNGIEASESISKEQRLEHCEQTADPVIQTCTTSVGEASAGRHDFLRASVNEFQSEVVGVNARHGLNSVKRRKLNSGANPGKSRTKKTVTFSDRIDNRKVVKKVGELEGTLCQNSLVNGQIDVEQAENFLSEELNASNDSGTLNLIRMLESEGEDDDDQQTVIIENRSRISRSAKQQTSQSSDNNLGGGDNENSEPNIWTMKKYIEQQKLHDKISTTCADPEKKHELLARLYKVFGEDSDEEEVWCSQQKIRKYRRRIANWVVRRLLPYYTEKRLSSRPVFKAVAKEITNKLICINHHPSEDDVERGVVAFFSYHGVIDTISDIWEEWGKALN